MTLSSLLPLLLAESPSLPLALLAAAAAFGLLFLIGKALGGQPASPSEDPPPSPPPARGRDYDERAPAERPPLPPPARGQAPIAPPAPREPSDALLEQVRDLLGKGKKLHAVKLYREGTGLGLKASKEAVEALGVRPLAPPPPAPSAPRDDGDIRDLLRAGKKLHAIKLYRQRYGSSLRDAKEAVEGML